MSEFDVVVLGAGPTGENVADYAVRGGLTAALVESERVGGECSFWACMPSKALLRTGHAVTAARRLPGVTATSDPAAVLARRDAITHLGDDTSQVEWARGAGIEVVRGHGRLVEDRAVRVGDDVLYARHAVVVATGSVPVRPPVPGLDTVRTWGSREATSASSVPPRLGVLGGGVVGCELAQAFAWLGSTVTLVNHGPRVLAAMEPAASAAVVAGLREFGVDVRLDQGLDSVAPGPGGTILLRVGAETVEVDVLLVATGRRPNTDDIGVDRVGLQPGRALEVDDSGLVTAVAGEWLHAAGDVTGRAPLTHQGKYEARITAAAVVARAAGKPVDTAPWGEHTATADHAAVPQVVFTEPEVASVGLTAARARDAGLPVRVVEIDIAVAGSTLHADRYTGTATMVVDTDRDVLVGLTFVGQDVGELIHAGTIAVVGEVPLSRLWHAVPAYPTISEVWLRLLEAYRG